MSSADARFVGSIPQHYDEGLGPLIFVDIAADLARRTAVAKPARVLETAAGTGIVTRALRDALPSDTYLVASDLNPPMLNYARGKFGPAEQVDFQIADAMALPFADGSFDAVVCQCGVMFFPDKAKSYQEVFRVLAPGGSYHFNVWDTHRYNSFGRISHEVAGSFFPVDPPQFQKVPFSYSAIDPIKESLLAAGFTRIDVTVERFEKAVPDVALLARGIVYGSPLIDQIKTRGDVSPEHVFDAMAQAFRDEFGDPGHMPLQIVVVSAKKPI